MSNRRHRVGITDYVRSSQIEAAAFPEAEFVVLGASDLQDDLGDLDGLLVWHKHITPEVVARLDRCRVVVRYGVGFDKIDIDSLARRGIAFCNTPDYGTEEVADTACAMMLSLQRKVTEYDRAARGFANGWQENTRPPLRRLSSQVVGVIGVGRIGTAVMNRMRPFGVRLVGFDPFQPSGHEKAIGYSRVRHVEELLETADIVSIHCPLTPQTIAMMDSAAIARMRRGSVLVNTARGEILRDLDCIHSALESEHLSAVGLDVLPDEPPDFSHPLILAWGADEPWIRGRLIINPHAAYFSDDAWYEMRFKAAETVRMALVEGVVRNRILAR
jgi:D-3-phosphoglycerate dehydrogenase